MRNLKKFLALVLAMMMVFSLMITVNAASTDDFTDSEEVKSEYKEALEVMIAVGIINGTGNGKISPNGNFQRQQLAALMYLIETGDVDSTSLTLAWAAEDDCFTDVPKSMQLAKYINYAYGQGWVDGVGDGTFNPYGTVTVVEVLRAMLSILDLDDNVSAGNWMMDTLNEAHKYELDAGLTKDVSYTGVASRQVAAQIYFNALNYTSQTGYVYTVFTGNDPTDPANILYQGPDYNLAMLYVQSQGASVISTPSTKGSLADTKFNGLHKEAAGGRDAFYRPTNRWTNNDGDDVAVFPQTAYLTFNGNFTGNVYKTLKNTATIYYNGVADVLTGDNGSLFVDDNTGVPGYEVEVYRNGAGYDVIVREAYVAQVGETSGDPAMTALKVYEHNKVGGVDFSIPAAKLAGFAKDEWIAVYAKPGWDTTKDAKDILEVASLTKEAVTIKQINDNGKNVNSSVITTAGAVYRISNEAMSRPAGAVTNFAWTVASKNINVGAATLYTLNGNILFVDQTPADAPAVTARTGYAYLFDSRRIVTNGEDKWQSEGGNDVGGGNAYEAKLLLTSGEIVTVQTGTRDYKSDLGKLVYYTIGEHDVFTLTAIPGTTAASGNELVVNRNVAEGKVPGGSQYDVLFDSATVFIVVKTDDKGNVGGTNKNYNVDSKVYSIYDVPSFDDTEALVTVVGPLASNGDKTDFVDGEVAGVVLIRDPEGEKDPTLEGTYFIAYSANATRYRLLTDEDTGAYIEFAEYKAVMNGVIETVRVKVAASDGTTGPANGPFTTQLYSNPTVDDNGIITALGTPVSENVLTVTGVSKVVNDKITLNPGASSEDYLVSVNSTKAYEYDANGNIKEIVLADIAEDNGYTGGYAVRNNTSGVLTTLYLTK